MGVRPIGRPPLGGVGHARRQKIGKLGWGFFAFFGEAIQHMNIFGLSVMFYSGR